MPSVISQRQLNRILARGGKASLRAKKPTNDLDELEEAAIGNIQMRQPEPAVEPVVAPVIERPVAEPVVAPAVSQPDNSNATLLGAAASILEIKREHRGIIARIREKHSAVVSALRSDLRSAMARLTEKKPLVAWTHKIRRARGLIDMIISWRTGEKLIAWTHKVIRTPQGLIDTILSTDGEVTVQHRVLRKNGVMDKIYTTKTTKEDS